MTDHHFGPQGGIYSQTATILICYGQWLDLKCSGASRDRSILECLMPYLCFLRLSSICSSVMGESTMVKGIGLCSELILPPTGW